MTDRVVWVVAYTYPIACGILPIAIFLNSGLITHNFDIISLGSFTVAITIQHPAGRVIVPTTVSVYAGTMVGVTVPNIISPTLDNPVFNMQQFYSGTSPEFLAYNFLYFYLDKVYNVHSNRIIKWRAEGNEMKYNLSNIMKRAWELVKKIGMTISSGLKKAWEEAKNPVIKSEKEILIDRLNEKAAEANSHNNSYHYNVYISNWENYGKSRTYFSIYETRANSRHSKKISYGYYDNQAEKYIPEKYNDLTKNYTVSGMAM